MEELETDNTSKTDATSKPWLWKKGFCPNPGGRPAGMTMKAYAKAYLAKLTDEERDEWLEGLSKDIVWKMAEGQPDTKTHLEGELTISGVNINVRK